MNETKKIVVLGAGESGVGAALLAQKVGYRVFVSDSGHIAERYQQELGKNGISFEANNHSEAKILEADVVVKSPGIPETASIIQILRKQNKEIISEIEWAYRHIHQGKIIAITGTNGKSTTTSLIGHILKESGLNVAVGGNIGISFARLLATAPAAAWYVLEVSSFQLDDIKSFRPNIAVILNITHDHLNRYKHDFNQYIAAKFKITQYQKKEDYLILNVDDPTIKNYLTTHQTNATIVEITMSKEKTNRKKNGATVQNGLMDIFLNDEHTTVSIHDLKIKGKHNIYNSMAAGISAKVAGIRKEKIKECFESFQGLEHRLEYVATVRGVDFINDSKGTNLNSVWFALESMAKPVVLILGGQDKGNDYDQIKELVQQKVHAIVCLGLDNRPILKAFSGVIPQIVETQGARDAVNAAYALAEKGDVVLLSPGCASFDLFKNFEDRGHQFKEAVREL